MDRSAGGVGMSVVPTKLARVLEYLARGRSLNRFEAERLLSDHCLHSTVSEIQGRGVLVDRHMESVPGFQGQPTRVARYRIAARDEREKARMLLRAMGAKGKPAVAAAGSVKQSTTETAQERHVQSQA